MKKHHSDEQSAESVLNAETPAEPKPLVTKLDYFDATRRNHLAHLLKIRAQTPSFNSEFFELCLIILNQRKLILEYIFALRSDPNIQGLIKSQQKQEGEDNTDLEKPEFDDGSFYRRNRKSGLIDSQSNSEDEAPDFGNLSLDSGNLDMEFSRNRHRLDSLENEAADFKETPRVN